MNVQKAACNKLIPVIAVIAAMLVTGCNLARHVPEGRHWLQKNKVTVTSENVLYNKGVIKDNLAHLVGQKPNTYRLLGGLLPNGALIPIKLWAYNVRYKKLHSRPDSTLPKYAERPVLYDSATITKSLFQMRSYLVNLGFFYAKVKDTVVFRGRKAYVTYKINTGTNYLINKIHFDIDDSAIARTVAAADDETLLKRNTPFTYTMLNDELSRITAAIRNNGFYKFSQENIRFELDTMDKSFFRDVENPLENAINFIGTPRKNKKPTLDIYLIIRIRDDTDNVQYRTGNVTVYPDYGGAADRKDSSMFRKVIDSVLFKYHQNYVHAKVLSDRVFLRPRKLYSQADYDKTIVKLNELGIFQYIRIQLFENKNDSTLDCNIYLNRAKKHDLNADVELTSGSTYKFGFSGGASYRDKNFAKGANLLSLSLNGGNEYNYDHTLGNTIADHFTLQTQYYGANTSVDFPKFLAPVPASLFDNSSLPHTIVTGGINAIDKVQYFTLVNTSSYFKYNWHESATKTWEFSPAFVNIIRLPVKTDSFKNKLLSNQFLRDSYKEIFIEGENISYTFNRVDKKTGKVHFTLKLGAEEAGGLLGAVNSFGYALNDLFNIKFAQYVKFDFDAQRFFFLPFSVFAFRMYGGIGIPNGQLSTLPYVKQYYVGGPYSLRGWRIRTLGPGSSYDTAALSGSNTIDRTGDIKLEWNGEYRFPIAPLFAGTVKMNGALFADAGNIWLARKDSTYTNGEFNLSRLGHEIAMDVGAGTRFDIASFITLRLDVAIPVKKPYVESNNGWVFDQFDFKNSTWRANNVVMNISIGYSF